jgi:uncharacterized protein (TIGR02145 family)
MKTLPIFIFFLMITSEIFCQGIVYDIDGNFYDTVHVGNQVWLKENLKVSRFNNGDPIIETTSLYDWWSYTNLQSPNYGTPIQTYYNMDTSLLNRYGRFYTWYVAGDNRNVCPTGWKVPSYMDYYEMFSFVDSTTLDLLDYNDYYVNDGVMNDQSGKKFLSNQFWDDQNLSGNNQTRWSGLPGGFIHLTWSEEFQYSNIMYFGDGFANGFWTKDTVEWDMDGGFEVRAKSIHIMGDYIRMYPSGRGLGSSIRCIKDDTSSGFYEEIKLEPSIYPNPTNENVTFVSDDSFSGQTYELYEINGQLIGSGEITSTQQTINMSDQPTGVYMLKVKDKTFKIVKN